MSCLYRVRPFIFTENFEASLSCLQKDKWQGFFFPPLSISLYIPLFLYHRIPCTQHLRNTFFNPGAPILVTGPNISVRTSLIFRGVVNKLDSALANYQGSLGIRVLCGKVVYSGVQLQNGEEIFTGETITYDRIVQAETPSKVWGAQTQKIHVKALKVSRG